MTLEIIPREHFAQVSLNEWNGNSMFDFNPIDLHAKIKFRVKCHPMLWFSSFRSRFRLSYSKEMYDSIHAEY